MARFRAAPTEKGWKVEELHEGCEHCSPRWRTVFYTYYLDSMGKQEAIAKAAADALNAREAD